MTLWKNRYRGGKGSEMISLENEMKDIQSISSITSRIPWGS